ncbi:MAG: hypothetical protein ACM3PY_17810 [Omnitrophica WOR_2 bacterium]
MVQNITTDPPEQGKGQNESNNPPNQQMGQQNNPPNQGSSGPAGHLGENELSAERRYGLSMTNEDRKKSFQIEDERWSRDNQIKDWLKLGLMMVIMIVWMATVYFLEPGLR